MKKYIAFMLAAVLALSAAGCFAQVNAEDLLEDIMPQFVPVTDLAGNTEAMTDFAVRLMQASNEAGENTLISPLSVLYALSMTANGAKGETLTQMEAVLGMPLDNLNRALYSYAKALPRGDKYKLNVANSIWFTTHERFNVNRDFLQTVANYYDADIYSAAFDDTTLRDINNWVKDKTGGMIPEILDQIPDEAVMYLVNALAFDAEWAVIYNEHSVLGGYFTREDGTRAEAEFMYSEEDVYLEDNLATGFVKYYADRSYAFVALLPNEGVTVADYLASLNGEHLQTLLSSDDRSTVHVRMPKFEVEYDVEMSEILMDMGMELPFGGGDLSGLGTSTDGDLYINRVLHKTYISVDERGTKAGAATAVEVNDECAVVDVKTVYLDRPFVYMIVDCENGVPVFIGTLMEP